MSRVLVTDHPAPSVRIEAEVLEAVGAELVLARQGDENELLSLVADADAILTCFRHVTGAVIRRGDRLKTIARYGVGVDNIAVDVATERGISVTNVPVYCVDEVAEHAIALLMTLVRRTARYDADIRAGGWRIETGMPIHRLSGSSLGVVGFGNIGRAVARRALGLGLRVLVADPSEPEDAIHAAGAEPRSLDDLLAESDAVTLHAPLRAETHHLLDGRRLALMRRGSLLINCARGGIVDPLALATALSSGAIGGAGIDVFEPERLPLDHPLMAAPNTVFTPHVAFYSEESIAELCRQAAENVADVLAQRTSSNIVNAGALTA
jgi:D-3-phosphoglycerate dehydrogenase / 2-oxoglutarate reductase